MPSEVKVKVQISDCNINNNRYLHYRGKLWVPKAPILLEIKYKAIDTNRKQRDILRTKLIQSIYNSLVYSHPGQDSTAFILGRHFY